MVSRDDTEQAQHYLGRMIDSVLTTVSAEGSHSVKIILHDRGSRTDAWRVEVECSVARLAQCGHTRRGAGWSLREALSAAVGGQLPSCGDDANQTQRELGATLDHVLTTVADAERGSVTIITPFWGPRADMWRVVVEYSGLTRCGGGWTPREALTDAFDGQVPA
jgi:hypothetical protein